MWRTNIDRMSTVTAKRGSVSYELPNGNAPADFSQEMLFEIAWEVANKVGGIYTVIRTKVPVTVAEFGERYCLIGPWNKAKAGMEVDPMEIPSRPFREAVENMRAAGVDVMYGKWLIDGAPAVLLFDLNSARKWLGEWKTDIWLSAQIPSPPDDAETDEAILFGYLVQWFIGEYLHRVKTAEKHIASDLWLSPPSFHHAVQVDPDDEKFSARHPIYSEFKAPGNAPDGTPRPLVTCVFHEWLVGVGLILLRKKSMDCATVFVTHATLLGRYLCAGAADFYNNVPFFNCDEEAGRRNIYQRYCIERGAAQSADVFATVSGITGYEAEHLLKRKPDGIVPNGLNVKKFQALHEFQNLHARAKDKLHEFARSYFYGHYDFDLDNTLYFFTAGRLEHRNKGLDMYIEGLARLNGRMKYSNSPMTVIAFVVTAAPTNGFSVEALKGQAVMKQLRDTVEQISKNIGTRMLETAARKTMPDPVDLLTDDDLVALKRRIYALKRDQLPPIVTHNMVDDSKDPILAQLRVVNMFNDKWDRVKIIYHPEFLNSNNPILPLDYDDFVRGCHLGVFPSYYEPWGYTPAECTIMGVPSITSNLSGFGNYMEELVSNPSDYGIYIVDRRFKSPEESMEQLTGYMYDFTRMSRRARITQRNRTERLSDLLDWKRMNVQYQKMRHLAIQRHFPDAILSTEPAQESPALNDSEHRIVRDEANIHAS